MQQIRTGMRVRLDGSKGEVEMITSEVAVLQRVEDLRCEYKGPMQGRNRNRALNHLGAVSARLQIVQFVRSDRDCLQALGRHFEGGLPADDAAEQILDRLNQGAEPFHYSKGMLENWVHRHHLEFHACDRCNLRCSGCTYFQDTAHKPDPLSFPFEAMEKLCSTFQPRAITVVGGGEPLLYRSGDQRLGYMVCALGNGDFGCAPAIGLITNGTLWPPGDPRWHRHVEWIRYSLDTATPESYKASKGKDLFERVVDNVFRTLADTDIPQVGVGFLYQPGNIMEAVAVISLFADRIRYECLDQLHRLNVQFRPFRVPTGRPSIQERILSDRDIERAAAKLVEAVDRDSFLKAFVQNNTNIAVNLLCGGAREHIRPFAECVFGLAKTVIRADGSLYPCFRMAAQKRAPFYCGNILTDAPLEIALRELYVAASSVPQLCVPEHDKCLFCVFNNLLEEGLSAGLEPEPELAGRYFF
jgi:MoaA/NifB/PqqE/SkfB family radical SAM enzyme